VSAVFRLYGCSITDNDADRLVAALTANSSRAASHEAAAAIRWGTEWELTAEQLEPDLRDALLDALATVDASAGLVQLRDVLERSALTEPKRHRLARRLHNPRRRHCECLSDCWCKRTTWGQMLRWYIPSPYHSSISAGGQQRHEAAG
jgi:hypothetical protein